MLNSLGITGTISKNGLFLLLYKNFIIRSFCIVSANWESFIKVNTKRCEDILIKEITLLNELKERVIADTVTGKIDVRDTIIPEHVCDDEYNIIYEDSKCEEENEDQNF